MDANPLEEVIAEFRELNGDEMLKRMIFELSMPSNNSWNGKWSGAESTYTVAKSLTHGKAEELKPRYTYNFGDGWVAAVAVREAKPREKPTNKFCGYEWMIDSILKRNAITAA